VTGENISLPTEQQWQRAAQGDTNWSYPWGNEFDKNWCNWNTRRGTTPVTLYEYIGDSPFKVVDLAGNVWEWCRTDFDNGIQDDYGVAKFRLLRGGSWSVINESILRTDYRLKHNPDRRDNNLGFRVAHL
jgi:formylglycine-generating enzyme required for sulfatase activity